MRITANCPLSVGLTVEICPSSTVSAADQEITARKEILVSPFGGHEVVVVRAGKALRYLRQRLTP